MNNTPVVTAMLYAGLLVAGVGAVVAAGLYAAGRNLGQRLFRPLGPIPTISSGSHVIAAFAVWALSTMLVRILLVGSGFFQLVYGPDFPGDRDTGVAANLQLLWAQMIAFPGQLAFLIYLARLAGARTTVRWATWPMSGVAGYLTWLLVTPVVICVFVLASVWNAALTDRAPDPHPLTKFGEAAGASEWALFVLSVVVWAPVLEEFLFRGLLIPWMLQRRDPPMNGSPYSVPRNRRSWTVLLVAPLVAFVFQLDEIGQAWVQKNAWGVAVPFIPVAFILALLPLYMLLPDFAWLRRHLRIRSTEQVRAIVASSALFAAFHSAVWPSPVPLVFLAMSLGYLYVRTRSLIGPIVVHALFNALSATYLHLIRA